MNVKGWCTHNEHIRWCGSDQFFLTEGGGFRCAKQGCYAVYTGTATIIVVDTDGNVVEEVEVTLGKVKADTTSDELRRTRKTTLPRMVAVPRDESPGSDDDPGVPVLDKTPPDGTKNPFEAGDDVESIEAGGDTELIDMGSLWADVDVAGIDPNLLPVLWNEEFATANAIDTGVVLGEHVADSSDDEAGDEVPEGHAGEFFVGGMIKPRGVSPRVGETPMTRVRAEIADEVRKLGAEKPFDSSDESTVGDTPMEGQAGADSKFNLKIESGRTSSPAPTEDHAGDDSKLVLGLEGKEADWYQDFDDPLGSVPSGSPDETSVIPRVYSRRQSAKKNRLATWFALAAIVITTLVSVLLTQLGSEEATSTPAYSTLTQCVEGELQENGLAQTMRKHLVAACREQGYK